MTDLIQQFSDSSLDVFSSRRSALRKAGQLGLGAALAAVPFLKPSSAKAQSMDGDFGILNYALTLEYLERSFYNQALGAVGDDPDGDGEMAAPSIIPDEVRPLFTLIRDHENQHVALLSGAIATAGGTPVQYTDDDFTFDGFLGSFANIATLAQGLEDTGVRAYKGQAANIMSKAYLTVALQIHSVEARHAAAIRRLAASPAVKGWIPFDQPNVAGTPIEATYEGEGNTTQGGVELTSALSGYSEEEITEAFDETLTMDQVLAIAGGFITGEEGDGADVDGDGTVDSRSS